MRSSDSFKLSIQSATVPFVAPKLAVIVLPTLIGMPESVTFLRSACIRVVPGRTQRVNWLVADRRLVNL